MTAPAPPILAVSGLTAETRIARGAGIVTVTGGGDGARLDRLLVEAGASGARAVISFGIAGGLAPGLLPGTVVVAAGVAHDAMRWGTDPSWQNALLAALPQALCGDLVGVDHPVADAGGKARLHRGTGALAVDMESHVAARFASRNGWPFAALRVIADPSDRSLPRAALVGMRPDGTTDVPAVIKALARRPTDLPALVRTAFDAKAAFAALRRSRSQAGASFRFGPAAWPRTDAGADEPPRRGAATPA